ncbi:MAG: 23S rRNA (uracil(1939)-C(5))-methyltransferase RlmD [Clostridia bacterium]|nr:23S rRNA (uracil(1939)-C(5))-methyltransferase RlmD [Clostridia bacterium]
MKLSVGQEIIVDVLSTGANGEGVGKYDNLTVFVKGAIDSERVKAKITKVAPTFLLAKLTEVIVSSPHRVKPICKNFGNCAGCDLLHMTYEHTLSVKQKIVLDTLKHVGGIDTVVSPTVPSTPHTRYRNKLALPIAVSSQGKTLIGFYREKSHQVVPTTDCVLQGEWIVDIIDSVRGMCDRHPDFRDVIRHVVVRETGAKLMVTFVLRRGEVPDIEEFVYRNPKVSSIYISYNRRDTNVILGDELVKVYGDDRLSASTLGVRYTLSPYSFGQINDNVRDMIYNAVLDNIESDDIVIDAYSGAGLMTTILASKAREVYGIEIIPSAVRDADEVARLNGVSHKVTNIEGDCATQLPLLVDNLMRRRDIKNISVVLDPPRKGCDESVLEAVLRANPTRIIYVSCNPATLARDLKTLTKHYDITSVTPYDMFPYTKHVESVVCLTRRLDN